MPRCFCPGAALGGEPLSASTVFRRRLFFTTKNGYNGGIENDALVTSGLRISGNRVDERAVADRRAGLEALLRERLNELDSDAQVRFAIRPDGKVDITVVSVLFEGKDSREREALFWPVFDPVPKSELIHLTYCLLLTPEEARLQFNDREVSSGGNAENWDE